MRAGTCSCCHHVGPGVAEGLTPQPPYSTASPFPAGRLPTPSGLDRRERPGHFSLGQKGGISGQAFVGRHSKHSMNRRFSRAGLFTCWTNRRGERRAVLWTLPAGLEGRSFLALPHLMTSVRASQPEAGAAPSPPSVRMVTDALPSLQL